MQRHRGFDALVAQLPPIEDHLRKAARRSRRPIQEQIRRAPLVPGDLERRASVPRRGVESTLELFHAFRLDVRRAGDARDVRPDIAPDDGCRERRELLAEQGLVTRLAVRGAQFEITPRTEKIRESKRSAGLREDIKLARVPEYAAPFGAQSSLDR